MPFLVRLWEWPDVDPAGREFDPTRARATAIEVMSEVLGGDLAQRTPPRGVKRRHIEEQLETALTAAYGPWVSGWNWAASEPGSGGPVRAWCCDDHSILGKADPDAMATVERVVAAVTEWHAVLEELSSVFAELRAATAKLGRADRTEHAAARLVAWVIERTQAEDAWYATFATLLRWFLQSSGDDVDPARLYEVMNGKFESWLQPQGAVVASTARELGEAVAGAATAPPRDVLGAWLAIRTRRLSVDGFDVARRSRRVDAHRAFIEGAERARDPVRADRMARALDACRASAQRGEPLEFDRLAAWQRIVLGEQAPVPWRTADAFARHVRYAYSADLPQRFDAALAEANGVDPVADRAARAYLDVAFFHPFADGNARAARLALDHVLARAGLGLAAIEPIILLQRAGDDASGAYWLARTIDQLAGPLA